ncbi:MAG: hypothetical protein AAGI11_10550 [Pseudomonadota bacterium]
MTNLFLLLLAIFGGVALMVVVLERFGSPMSPDKQAKLSRWIYPLVGISLVISIINYYFL